MIPPLYRLPMAFVSTDYLTNTSPLSCCRARLIYTARLQESRTMRPLPPFLYVPRFGLEAPSISAAMVTGVSGRLGGNWLNECGQGKKLRVLSRGQVAEIMITRMMVGAIDRVSCLIGLVQSLAAIKLSGRGRITSWRILPLSILRLTRRNLVTSARSRRRLLGLVLLMGGSEFT